MQRRIFRLDGQDCLVTSDSGYHETHGTLMAALTAVERPAPEATRSRTAPPPPVTASQPPDVDPEGSVPSPLGTRQNRDEVASLPVASSRGTEEAKAALWNEIVEKAAAMGLSADTLLPPRGAPATRDVTSEGSARPLIAKYHGPAGETWTGRGRRPGWLVQLLNEGRDLEEFRV